MSLIERGITLQNHANNPEDEFMKGCDSEYFDKIRKPTKNFLETVLLDGRFLWMGVFGTTDELGVPHAVVYLQEGARPIKPQDVPRKTTVGEAFAELALALRPKLALAGPYYLTSTDGKEEITEGDIQGLEEEIKDLYETEEVGIVCSWNLPINPIEL